MAGLTTNAYLCEHDASCTESSYAMCPHCTRDLCLEHLIEHQQMVRRQFDELINQVNDQKAILSTHSSVYKIRDEVIADLDQWKSQKIETIIAVYKSKRLQIENACQQCVDENANIQASMLEEINTPWSMIEKKKNVHPNDIQQIERKLKEISERMETLQKNAEAELSSTVQNLKLPDVIELEEQLHDAQAEILDVARENQQVMQQVEIILRQISNARFVHPKDHEMQQRIYTLYQKLRIFRN